jgi:predicted nucleotidyltransferase
MSLGHTHCIKIQRFIYGNHSLLNKKDGQHRERFKIVASTSLKRFLATKPLMTVEPQFTNTKKGLKMTRFHEAALVDSTDEIQFKVYSSTHPKGFIIAKPKYIPEDLLSLVGLKKRFLFSKCMYRFNLFNDKETVEYNLKEIREKFPYYIYECKKHNNWFLGVPEDRVKKFYDTKKGLQELLKVPIEDLDSYLKSVRNMVDILSEAGIPKENIGISHSTLLGNYTPGKSDIDILVFGIDNGWKAIKHLENSKNPSLKWKSKKEWAWYYKDRVVSKVYSEEEYVANMIRKRDDGFIDGNVFSMFCIENEDESWYDWESEHIPLKTVKIRGKVKDAYHSIVRPGYYELEETKILDGYNDVPVKRVVTWARPYSLQAKENELIEACGLLEKVKSKEGEFYQLVIGYFDTYTSGRGEKEYLKAMIN